MFGLGKKTKVNESGIIQNWYSDRYMSVLVQRNFLFIFAIISCFGVLVSLIFIKDLYEKKYIDPYLIQVDDKNGIMTIIDPESKKSYTAHEVVKDYFIKKYIDAREAYKTSSIEEDINLVRIFSSKAVYNEYIKEVKKDVMALKSIGFNARYETKILSYLYIDSKRLEIRFQKQALSDDNQGDISRFKLILVFDFLDLELSYEDRMLNPLGFQILYYSLVEDKIVNQSEKY